MCDVQEGRFEGPKSWVTAGNEACVSVSLSKFSTRWPHNCHLLLLFPNSPAFFPSTTHPGLSIRPQTESISPQHQPSSHFWIAQNMKTFPFQSTKDPLYAPPPPKCFIFYLPKDGKNRPWKPPDCCQAACSWQKRNGEALITASPPLSVSCLRETGTS